MAAAPSSEVAVATRGGGCWSRATQRTALSRNAKSAAQTRASAAPTALKSCGRTRSRVRVAPPATMSTVPATSATWKGSPSSVSAINTEISGAVPIRIAARDGPASRTARTNTICDTPGTSIPTSANAQSCPGRMLDQAASARAAEITNAVAAAIAAPASGSAPVRRAIRTVTASAPKQAPASTPNRTPSTVYLVPLPGPAALTQRIIDDRARAGSAVRAVRARWRALPTGATRSPSA